MAKKMGPKEASLRAAREAATATTIDRHALQEARAAARRKANELYEKEMQSITKPLRDEIETLTARRAEIDAELTAIESTLTKLNKALADVLGIEPPSTGKASGGKRSRRSSEQLKTEASSIVAYLEKHPKAKASDIKKATGVNFAPSLVKFVKENNGAKIATEGNKASTVYSLA
jgi:chromosome segregation ATPase